MTRPKGDIYILISYIYILQEYIDGREKPPALGWRRQGADSSLKEHLARFGIFLIVKIGSRDATGI